MRAPSGWPVPGTTIFSNSPHRYVARPYLLINVIRSRSKHFTSGRQFDFVCLSSHVYVTPHGGCASYVQMS